MASLRTLLLGFAFALFALIQLSSAAPVAHDLVADAEEDCEGDPFPTENSPTGPTGSQWPSTTPTLPKSGDATELASPPSGQTVQYVAIGRGIQNYTCASAGAKPVALGAVATLFDFTELAYHNEMALHLIPPVIVNVPLSELSSNSWRLPPVLGKHFFGADGTPTFDLYTVDKILYGKKIGDIKAPANASAGPSGTGAVDWLELIAKTGVPAESSVDLSTVYRVVTAGGNAPATCPDTNLISEQYAAEYWFFN